MLNGTQNHPLNGGWSLNIGETRSITVSGLLSAARFWPRTGCKTKNGGPPTLENPLRCETGDCWNPTNNGFECAGITGQPPATLFEVTLTGLGAAKDDTYDVSVVDGYNVGIAVQSVGGHPLGGQWQLGDKYNCGGAQCTFNMAQKCPSELRLQSSDGSLAGCSSICTAVKGSLDNPYLNKIRNGFDNITGFPLTNLVCCDCAAGPSVGCESAQCQYGCSPHDRSNPGGKCFAENWPVASNGIPYQDLYKDDCPDSYAWQFADQTSTFHCINADYNIQFCPENKHTSPPVQTSAPHAAPGKPPSVDDNSSAEVTIIETTTVSSQVASGSSTDTPIHPLTEDPINQQQPLDQIQSNRVAPPLKTGAIIGITVGGVGFILLVSVVIAVGFIVRRRRAMKNFSETSQAI